jgi:formylglycine-generating enzyme required for sulfatase activity
MRPLGISLVLASVSVGVAGVVAAPAAHADAGSPAAPDDLVLDLGGTTLETKKVTHGSFTQGSAPGDPGHEKDEEPARPVTITRDFWIGKFPVTRGQFAKFVADTRYVSDAEKGQSGGAGWDGKALVQKKDFTWRNPGFTQTDEHPVVMVSYGDATAFVGWASRKSGKRVRLPTEAEWELAARGGTTTSWYGGAAAEAEPAAFGWFKGNAGNGTRPVGQKKPNPFGLYDVSGNVFEWCRDLYGPYHEGIAVDPEASTNTGNEPERRVLRGGSWLKDAKRGRSAARYRNAPGSRNADNGFRVVVTNEEAVGPAVTGGTSDFAPASPLGAGASNATGTSGAAGSAVASGPLADGQPTRVDPVAHSSEAFSWGLLLVSPLAAASSVVAWMLLRRKRAPGVPAAGLPGVSTRTGADGFFVRSPGLPPGSRARYACIVNGAEVSDVVPLDGAMETFVYTGSAPTAIRIVEIIPGARGGYREAERPAGTVPVATSTPRRAPPVPPRAPPPVPPSRPALQPQPQLPPPPPRPAPRSGTDPFLNPILRSPAFAIVDDDTSGPDDESSTVDMSTTADMSPKRDASASHPSLDSDKPSNRDVSSSAEKPSNRDVSSSAEEPSNRDVTSGTDASSTASDPFLGNPRAY